MSYALRNDGLGWRSVKSPEDCDSNETWSATPPSATVPMPIDVAEPPALTSQQITKLADFLTTNPDIAKAFGIQKS